MSSLKPQYLSLSISSSPNVLSSPCFPLSTYFSLNVLPSQNVPLSIFPRLTSSLLNIFPLNVLPSQCRPPPPLKPQYLSLNIFFSQCTSLSMFSPINVFPSQCSLLSMSSSHNVFISQYFPFSMSQYLLLFISFLSMLSRCRLEGGTAQQRSR